MYRIVPAIASLEQHLLTLVTGPQQYRPAQCPHCGRGRPWSHGCYERKADRVTGALNPIPVPEFEPYAYLRRLFTGLPAAQTVEQIEAPLPWKLQP
jgi:hypothetical protein